MNIGEPKHVREIEPVSLPVPEVPAEEPIVVPEEVPVEEPAKR